MQLSRIIREVSPHIVAALKEDRCSFDITTKACVDPAKICSALVISKEETVLAGMPVFTAVMKATDKRIRVTQFTGEGEVAKKGTTVAKVHGKCDSILRAERVALNYLQRLCGIASLTARFVALTKGTKAKVFDTRKTTPTLRLLEKYAVRCGGGNNHRMNLSDCPLIKENHIRAAGGIRNAVSMVRNTTRKPLILEVTTKEELLEGLQAEADILLLDNFTPAEAKKMCAIIGNRAIVEVSGGVNLKTARKFAMAGVDRISVGSLTHSAPASDLSLLFEV